MLGLQSKETTHVSLDMRIPSISPGVPPPTLFALPKIWSTIKELGSPPVLEFVLLNEPQIPENKFTAVLTLCLQISQDNMLFFSTLAFALLELS